MVRKVSLSNEVARIYALSRGGAGTPDALVALRKWALLNLGGSPRANGSPKTKRAPSENMALWHALLVSTLGKAQGTGAPVGPLLGRILPMVRRQEWLEIKMRGLERQFALQGAIALVLPWAVAGFCGQLSFSFFTLAGALWQMLGLAAFSLVVRRALKVPEQEGSFLFNLVLGTWMSALAGQSLLPSLESALSLLSTRQTSRVREKFQQAWSRWLYVQCAGAGPREDDGQSRYRWDSELPQSAELSATLQGFAKNGAPVGEALSGYLEQLEEERRAVMEEKVAIVPTQLSLIFSGFFAPAFFLILLGVLWPQLSTMSDLWM